jgi:hypothetical protein
MPRVQDCCVGDTTKPLAFSTPVSLLIIWFSRKLLPWRALPQTDMVDRGPLMLRRAFRASCPTSHFCVLSLKPIRSKGWP